MNALKKYPHTTMNNVFNYLADNYHIGIIASISAWALSNFSFMFDESVLQIVGGVGIYLGIFVAFLTIFLKAMDLYDNIRKRFKK